MTTIYFNGVKMIKNGLVNWFALLKIN